MIRFSFAFGRRAVRNFSGLLPLLAALAFFSGCDRQPVGSAPPSATSQTATASPTNSPDAPIPTYGYEVVSVWPHDRGAFTQGLVYWQGKLLESTGLNGESSLREDDLMSGEVLRKRTVAPQYFAEGLALLGGKLFQLTWQEKKAFVYDLNTFEPTGEFNYDGEGWGLTTDGQSLIMSDGTSQIRFRDPATFAVQRTINVIARGHPVNRLNELEYIKGEVYANIWGTDYMVGIDPATGAVVGAIDFTGLLPREDRHPDTDVLNGIAYDPDHDRLFVTGKRWPKIFEVKLVRKR